MSIDNLLQAAAVLAARLEEDISFAATRADHIRLTDRANQARELERLARKETSTIGVTIDTLIDAGLEY